MLVVLLSPFAPVLITFDWFYECKEILIAAKKSFEATDFLPLVFEFKPEAQKHFVTK